MKKKILSLVLALLMSASSAAAIAANDVEPIAEDAAVTVSEDTPYAWAVEFLCNYGIYKGDGESLATEEDIQRYQMALFVSRISTGWVEDDKWEDGPENTSIFKDIDEAPAANYLGAISYANQKGIIEGYGNGEFGPYDGITYQDALTMVTRTLGYQGLDWPWGYIQEAVELGLTAGITDVAYTDILTRGEVAQIIYNALFAPTKTGSTLALKYFGVEFGWEPIVITASDLDVYEAGAANTPADANKENAFVSFKMYNEDGSVDTGKDAVTYYALAEDLGLDAAKHEDDLAVGTTMWVLFEKDADSNLVNIVDYKSTAVDLIMNEGKTDDDAQAQSYAIKDYIADYTLVSKYTPINYLSATKLLKPEIMVYNALAQLTETYVNGSKLAIDWNNGNILVEVEKEADADLTVDGKFYEIKWYWNATLEKYYELKKGTDDEVIGINWMTDEEFEATYKAALTTATKDITGFNKHINSVGGSAYASLYLEDVNLDGVAERGIYEEYGLGYFKESSKQCGSCNKTYASYSITPVTNEVDASGNILGVRGTVMGAEVNEFAAKPCGHYDYKSAAWFAEGYAPSQDEDGAYLPGYVIYSYDKDTKEIKIVKEIENGSDKDSYVDYGVLRAYSPAQKKVTIGDQVYTMNYDELKNNGFYKTADNKLKYTVGFDSMYNNYVKYVVVDGELVYMHLEGEQTGDFLVVKEYLGMTNDGYIAVEAYSAKTQALGNYAIGSYNGWKQGDYYYYLTEEKTKDAFSAGTIYYVKSYDKNEDVYFVELAGEYDDDYLSYTVSHDLISLTENVTVTVDTDGYVNIGSTTKKMEDKDTYVVLNPLARVDTTKAPIFVFKGKIANTTWTVTGDMIKFGDTYVFVNVTNVFGFELDSYASGMWLYEGGKVLEAGYDAAASEYFGNDFAKEGRYILGASTFKVEMLDLYTGKRDAVVIDKNIDLEKNHIYVTVSGKVVEEWDPWADNEIPLQDASSFLTLMSHWFYQDATTERNFLDSADYLFGTFTTSVTTALDKAFMNAQLVEDDHYTYNRERCKTPVVYAAYYNDDEMTVSALADLIAANPNALTIECAYIYRVSDGNVVIYVNAVKDTVKKDVVLKTTVAEDYNGVTGVDIVETLVADVYYDVDGNVTEVVVKSAEFEFVGADNMGHNDRALKAIGFGHLSDHVAGTYFTAADASGLFDVAAPAATPWATLFDMYMNRLGANVEYTTYACAANLCDLVKSIKFVNLDPAKTTTTVSTGDFDQYFTLKLTAGTAGYDLNPEDVTTLNNIVTWFVGGHLVVDGADVDFTAINDTITFNGEFTATNPDAIQDAVTAPIVVDAE